MSTESTDSPDVMIVPVDLRSAADPSPPLPLRGSSSQRPTGPSRVGRTGNLSLRSATHPWHNFVIDDREGRWNDLRPASSVGR